MKKKYFIGALIALILIGIAMFIAYNQQTRQSSIVITNFEECIKAGNPVLESYPAQCRTPDGKHFVEEIINDPYLK